MWAGWKPQCFRELVSELEWTASSAYSVEMSHSVCLTLKGTGFSEGLNARRWGSLGAP